jgi:hypothetical protein
VVGSWEFFLGDKVFDSFDPAGSFVECFRTIQICLCDNSKRRAFTAEIELAFWVNIGRPMERKVYRSAKNKLAEKPGLELQYPLRHPGMNKQSRRYLHVDRLRTEKIAK